MKVLRKWIPSQDMCPSKSSTVTGILNAIDMGNSQKRYCMGNYAFLALNNTSLNVGQTNSVIVEARRIRNTC